MTRWDRARFFRRCGRCGEEIPIGAPVFLLTIGRLTKERCAECAGPAPPDLPALIETTTPTATAFPFVRFTAGMLPLDWKSRQVGEREPGEDDV